MKRNDEFLLLQATQISAVLFLVMSVGCGKSRRPEPRVEKTVPPAEAVVEKGPLGSGDVVGFLDKKSITDVLAMEAGEGGMEPAAASAARKALWSRYAREQRDNPVRR